MTQMELQFEEQEKYLHRWICRRPLPALRSKWRLQHRAGSIVLQWFPPFGLQTFENYPFHRLSINFKPLAAIYTCTVGSPRLKLHHDLEGHHKFL